MITYKWLKIEKPNDFDQLIAIVPKEYDPKMVASELKASIAPTVCAVLVELGYIDKDYRSTYYKFYAKKGREYRDDCVRIHLFDDAVSFSENPIDIHIEGYNDRDDDDDEQRDKTEHHYFGYVVLRPTLVSTIGRSIVSPRARSDARGSLVGAYHQVHVLGRKLRVWGFPSMAQHTDISVCAHVSCWAILRHLSERFSQHREWLIHDITMMAQPFDPGGLRPSYGLDILEAERIFQAAGTFPLIVSKDGANDTKFYVQMLAYLESGFPLFVAMEGMGHAVVVVGFKRRDVSFPLAGKAGSTWDQIESLLVVDDNLLPYATVPLTKPNKTTQLTPTYGADQFDRFIVALPEKIFYPAEAVERASTQFIATFGKIAGLPDQDKLIRRSFVTTISALRRFARKRLSELGAELVDLIMRLETAQFLWIVEYATAEQWRAGHISARVVLDATASIKDSIPYWFAHDENQATVFDRGIEAGDAQTLDLNRPPSTPLGRMEQNLRPVINPR